MGDVPFTKDAIDAWFDGKCRKESPTELLVPVIEGIGPVYKPTKGGGGWFAYLATNPNPSGEFISECEHVHASEDEAWECADGQALVLAARVAGARQEPSSSAATTSGDGGKETR